MNYKVAHKTVYQYAEQAALSQNELCLFPRDTPLQSCGTRLLRIRPQPTILEEFTDCFGNLLHHFMVQQPHTTMEIIVESTVSTKEAENPAPGDTPAWEEVRDRIAGHAAPEDLEAYQFVFPSEFIAPDAGIRRFARASFPPGRPMLEAALDLTSRIYDEFTYDADATTVGTPLCEVLQNKRGVCQDFAHFQIACFRSLGLAARYVSGYLETIPPPGKPKLVGADASHAWLSVYIPGPGWVDLDPTNNLVPGGQHVTVAWGRDYCDVTPARGVIWGGGIHNLQVSVDVARLDGRGGGLALCPC